MSKTSRSPARKPSIALPTALQDSQLALVTTHHGLSSSLSVGLGGRRLVLVRDLAPRDLRQKWGVSRASRVAFVATQAFGVAGNVL